MHEDTTAANARIVELESLVSSFASSLAASQERIAALEKERDVLRASHQRLRLELELLKRRIFVAKAERVDTAQLELEFAAKLRELDELAGTSAPPSRSSSASVLANSSSSCAVSTRSALAAKMRRRRSSSSRRNRSWEARSRSRSFVS